MIRDEALRDQATLTGAGIRLEPLRSEHFDGYWPMLTDPEGSRLTGTHAQFTVEQVQAWLGGAKDRHDRADWAIVDRADGTVLGEVVLNELDEDNASMAFRISLVGSRVYGRGYGTKATRLVVGYGLDVVGLHRIHLGVYDFNPRAQRVYEKCGFVKEGVARDTLHWDGDWHDEVLMSILATDPRPA